MERKENRNMILIFLPILIAYKTISVPDFCSPSWYWVYLQDRRHVVVNVVNVVVVVVKIIKIRHVFVPHLTLSGTIPSGLIINLSSWFMLLPAVFPAHSMLPHYNNNLKRQSDPITFPLLPRRWVEV